MSRAAAVTQRLRVDPVACEGVGLCAQVADRAISLDRWGYPVLGRDLAPDEVRQARRAARACPRRALWVEEVGPDRR